MIITMLLSLVKSPKVIIGAVIVSVLAGAGFYVMNLQSERNELFYEVTKTKEKVIELQATNDGLQRQVEVQELTFEEYLDGQAYSQQKQERLMAALGKANVELRQCLDTPVPPEILNEIFKRKDVASSTPSDGT